MEDKQEQPRYEILELLARISGYKGLSYEIDEIKDGRIQTIKNIKIEQIDITKHPLK